MVFIRRGFTSRGQLESGSVFSAAVCKIQASKRYIKSLPLEPKDKRNCFFQSFKYKLSVLLPEGKRAIKRQLYSGP